MLFCYLNYFFILIIVQHSLGIEYQSWGMCLLIFSIFKTFYAIREMCSFMFQNQEFDLEIQSVHAVSTGADRPDNTNYLDFYILELYIHLASSWKWRT